MLYVMRSTPALTAAASLSREKMTGRCMKRRCAPADVVVDDDDDDDESCMLEENPTDALKRSAEVEEEDDDDGCMLEEN